MAKERQIPDRTRGAFLSARNNHEDWVMLKMGEDYYCVTASQALDICPDLAGVICPAIENDTAYSETIEIPRSLQGQWGHFFSIWDYLAHGCQLGKKFGHWETVSSFLTDTNIYLLATRHSLPEVEDQVCAAIERRARSLVRHLEDTNDDDDDDDEALHVDGMDVYYHFWSFMLAVKLALAPGLGKIKLRSALRAACQELALLLGEFPQFMLSVTEDRAVRDLWVSLDQRRLGMRKLSPKVKKRMAGVVKTFEKYEQGDFGFG